MKNTKTLAFKTFWKRVNRELNTASAGELRAILRSQAQETLPTERQTFLDQLKRRPETSAEELQVKLGDALLADIDDWIQELQSRMSEADDWEEWRGSGYDEYYDDEDSLGPYAEVVESLEALFDRVKAAFDEGTLQLARKAYAQLLGEALQQEDACGRGVRAEDVELDLRAARGRYLRAVYETTGRTDRPRVLFVQLQQVQTWLGGNGPMLDDLLRVSRRPLPEREPFLSAWIAFLHKQKGREADAWLREAIRLAEGTRGLEQLARTEGRPRPRVFLDWITDLAAAKKPREVIAAAQQALQTLPAKLPLRAKIAEHLCAAAAQLNEPETLQTGRWEASRPSQLSCACSIYGRSLLPKPELSRCGKRPSKSKPILRIPRDVGS